MTITATKEFRQLAILVLDNLCDVLLYTGMEEKDIFNKVKMILESEDIPRLRALIAVASGLVTPSALSIAWDDDELLVVVAEIGDGEQARDLFMQRFIILNPYKFANFMELRRGVDSSNLLTVGSRATTQGEKSG